MGKNVWKKRIRRLILRLVLETHQDIFLRSRLLLGRDFMQLLSQKRLIVFGIGGVGSWCVESLVRTGFSHVTLVDFDRINHSNINRQAMARQLQWGATKETS